MLLYSNNNIESYDIDTEQTDKSIIVEVRMSVSDLMTSLSAIQSVV